MNDVQRYFSKVPVDLQGLSGSWFIQKTSLDFWQNRFSPSVTYTLENDASGVRILDEVEYKNKRGHIKKVSGYDRLTEGGQGQFVWQGKPWYLRFLNSEWGIVAHDENYSDWAVTYFSKTALTPEGMDIYSRAEVLDDETYQKILALISEITFVKPFLDKLYQTK